MLHAGMVFRHTNTNPKSTHQCHFAYIVYCRSPKWMACFRPIPPVMECVAAGVRQTKGVHFLSDYTQSTPANTIYCAKPKDDS